MNKPLKARDVVIDSQVFGDDVSIALSHLKRQTDAFGGMGEQLSETLDSLNQYVNDVSSNNQTLKNPSSRAIWEGVDQIGGFYRRGLEVNKKAVARDTVIDNQTLAQLQDFVNDTVNLLRAVGKSDCEYLVTIPCIATNAKLGCPPQLSTHFCLRSTISRPKPRTAPLM